jgi:hypothetical protein
VTVEIGDCENVTAHTAIAGTAVISSLEHNGYTSIEYCIREASYQPTRDNHIVYHIICLSSASALTARFELTKCGRRDYLLCTMTRLKSGFPGNSGSVLGKKTSFSSPKLPEKLWLPPSPLLGAYRSWWKGGQAVKLSTYLYLISMLRMSEPIPPLPNSLTDSGKS